MITERMQELAGLTEKETRFLKNINEVKQKESNINDWLYGEIEIHNQDVVRCMQKISTDLIKKMKIQFAHLIGKTVNGKSITDFGVEITDFNPLKAHTLVKVGSEWENFNNIKGKIDDPEIEAKSIIKLDPIENIERLAKGFTDRLNIIQNNKFKYKKSNSRYWEIIVTVRQDNNKSNKPDPQYAWGWIDANTGAIVGSRNGKPWPQKALAYLQKKESWKGVESKQTLWIN